MKLLTKRVTESFTNCYRLAATLFYAFVQKVFFKLSVFVVALIFLTIYHFLSYLSSCDVPLPGLNHLRYWYDRQRTPLRDRGRLRNDPKWDPGFLSCCSWMFPEQLRNKSQIVGSKRIHRVYTKHPNCVNSSG